MGEKTVVFTLEHPSGPFLATLEMFNAGVVPKAVVEEMGDEALAQNPVGSGPFKLKTWKPNDHVILERNPNYWREDLPYLDKVAFIEVTNKNTRVSLAPRRRGRGVQRYPVVAG